MIEHKCLPLICWKTGAILFDNAHCHDYPQWHYVKTDEEIDEVILKTGMVASKSKLRRLYQQGAVKKEGNQLRIGQRVLIFVED